jgi:antitoxin MazE
MNTRITQWGNSLAVRIPKAMAESLKLQADSEIELTMADGALMIKPGRNKETLDELLSRITPENIHPPVDWGKPVGKEIFW